MCVRVRNVCECVCVSVFVRVHGALMCVCVCVCVCVCLCVYVVPLRVYTCVCVCVPRDMDYIRWIIIDLSGVPLNPPHKKAPLNQHKILAWMFIRY